MKVKRSPQYFLAWLLLVSIITQAGLAIIYVNYPDIPHDMGYYIWAGKMLLSGKPLYGILQSNGIYHPYGPLDATIFAGWMMLFGDNYISLKFVSIIFNSLIIITLFYLIKELINENAAKWGSFLYAFSYLPLFSSGALGNDDHLYVCFMLLSIYLLIKDKPVFAMVSFGISLGFGIQMVPVFPAIAYYLYRNYGLKKLLPYLSIMGITLSFILILFYFNSGLKVLYPYTVLQSSAPVNKVTALSTLNFFRLLSGFCVNAIHYLTTHTVIPKELNPIPPHTNHPINLFFNQIATPFFIIGGIFLLWYMFRFRLEDKKIELLRNSFLWIFGAFVFSKAVSDLHYTWLICPLLVLILFREQGIFNEFRLKNQEIFGTILTFIGLLILTFICCRGERVETWRWTLFFIPIIIPMGTYFMFYRTKIRKSWAVLMCGFACFEIMPANPLLILKPFLVKFIPETPISFGTYLSYATLYPFSLLTLLIVLIGIILLAKDMHCLMRENLLPANDITKRV
ncbi:MAG: glycosyltransferase family 39 protein [bacterium]